MHIPFCRTLCFYCGCHTIITKNSARAEDYVKLLRQEWSLYNRCEQTGSTISKRGVGLLHLGGGTPTYLSTLLLKQAIAPITELFGEQYEFSVEADPRSTTLDKLQLLKSLGCSRISLGIQDFDDQVQKKVNRVQPLAQIEQVLEAIARVDIKEVNFDLLYGLPGQTINSIRRTAELTVQMKPERIAWYGYAHVPWMKPAQAQWSAEEIPSGAQKRALYECGRSVLLEAGYEEIGMDHFALPTDSLAQANRAGTLSRNFMGYVTRRWLPLIGLGVSAIGESQAMFVQNEKDLKNYAEALNRGQLPIFRSHILDAEDQRRRDSIIEILALKQTSIKGYDQPVLTELHALEEDKLVSIKDQRVYVTERGLPLLRVIAAAFDAYKHLNQVNQFSKVV
jgi:oxygen-independent coproporphyrinogen III oxidase